MTEPKDKHLTFLLEKDLGNDIQEANNKVYTQISHCVPKHQYDPEAEQLTV
jgi:hypothetical protein